MSERKRKGLTFLISGLAFVAAGVVTIWVPGVSPALQSVLTAVGAAGSALGFSFVFPDLGDDT